MAKLSLRDKNSISKRSYHKYTFFKVDKAWRSLSRSQKESTKKEFVDVINDFSQRLSIRCFTLVGIRGDTDFMIWTVTDTIEDIHQIGCNLFATTMARYLDIPYSALATTSLSCNRPISALLSPNMSANISSVCSPSSGAGFTGSRSTPVK